MRYSYLIALLGGLLCMMLIDYRYKLAYFFDRRRTLLAVMTAFFIFVVWDIAGIELGIFFSGNSPYMSGIYLFPEFPVEEIVFLVFLCYFTLLLYRYVEKRC